MLARRLIMLPSEPRKMPVQGRSKATAAAIRDATARILAEEGYAAINTNRVADLAGVSVGSLYQYFPNKAALVGAVAVHRAEAMVEMLTTGIQNCAQDDMTTLVRKLIRAAFQAHSENPRLRCALIEQLPRLGAPARYTEMKVRLIDLTIEMLNARRDAVRVSDYRTAAFMIVNAIEHLSYLVQAAGACQTELDRLEEELNDWVISYLKL